MSSFRINRIFFFGFDNFLSLEYLQAQGRKQTFPNAVCEGHKQNGIEETLTGISNSLE